jgi:hypothetical protein
MPIVVTRSKVRPERVEAVENAGRQLFVALARQQPRGIRCFSAKLADGVSFVTVLESAPGADNPLPGMAEFRELQEILGRAVVEPPVGGAATIIGDFRMLTAPPTG